MTARARINGEDAAVEAATVAELLAERGVDAAARGVAVAVNGAVVRRPDWAGTPVREGDEIEIVKPFRGG